MVANAGPSQDVSSALLKWIDSVSTAPPALEQQRSLSQHSTSIIAILGHLLSAASPRHFASLAEMSGGSSTDGSASSYSESWVQCFSVLKRLYKLIVTYFEDILQLSTLSLAAPNLLLIAKSTFTASTVEPAGNGADSATRQKENEFNNNKKRDDPAAEIEMIRLVSVVLAALVQSEKRSEYVRGIQRLEEWVQRELMQCIELITSKVVAKPAVDQSILQEMTVNQPEDADSEFYSNQHERSQLLSSQEARQIMHDELARSHKVLQEDHEAALSSLAVAEKKIVQISSSVATGKNDATLKMECDRLRNELQRTENVLVATENSLESVTKSNKEMSKKIEHLTPLAESATQLSDQMDEYRHAAERARKNEIVMEKYKKKLEAMAELHQSIKALEDQNSDLLDKNLILSDSLEQSTALQLLTDSYRHQITTLESKSSALALSKEKLTLDLTKAKERLQEELTESRRKDERLREYAEGSAGGSPALDRNSGNVGNELDDAASSAPATITALKLKIRQLERGSTSAISVDKLVLDQQLVDERLSKERYESEFLGARRDVLRLESILEEVMGGQSKLGDGIESNVALRLKVEKLRKEMADVAARLKEVDGQRKALKKELGQATQDLQLVDQDKLATVRALRASLEVEKEGLSTEVDRLALALKISDEAEKRSLSQVNSLLSDTIALQNTGLSSWESLLSDRLTLSSSTESEIQGYKEKLQKAKAYIKQQDKLLVAAHASRQNDTFEESEESYRSQISSMTMELDRQKVNTADLELRYRREQQLMLSAYHELGMKVMRQSSATSTTGGAPSNAPTSWLGQARARANGKGLELME